MVMTVSTAPSLVRDLALPHAVADHLAAAELHLLAIGGTVLLDLDDEVGVGEAHAVAGGGAEHLGIDGTGDAGGHEQGNLQMGRWRNAGTFAAALSNVTVVSHPKTA